MTSFFIIFLLLIYPSAYAEISSYNEKFKALDFSGFELEDLCTNKPIQLDFSEIHRLKIWSLHCDNCLWQIEDTKKAGNIALINIDVNPIAACKWIKDHKIFLPVYHDLKKQIATSMNHDLPLPTALIMDGKKVKDVTIGYWRASQ